MYQNQNDERSSTARASASSSGKQHQQQHQRYHSHASEHGGRGFHRYPGSYGSASTPSSSLENQRSLEAQLSASTATTSSLFGDPVLPATRHADLLGGEDLYQNLKSNIELYHSKLFNDHERHRQAERDALFDQYAHGGVVAGSAVGGSVRGYRADSAGGGGGGGGSRSGSGSAGGSGIGSGRGAKSSVGHNVMSYGEVPPRSRNFARTQSAGLGVDLSNIRSNVLDMDLLKQNDWIDFTEHEYRHSLIPTTSRTVADVQQFAGANGSRKIENGVFQNPRAAAAVRASRRNSITDSSLYGMMMRSGGASALSERPPDSATFTVLGHADGGMHGGYDGMRDVSTSSEANSEYERMLRYGRTDPTTAILRDKINTGSNNRVSDGRQHKNSAFTIINEVLPKSSSFDMAGGSRYSPYREKHRMASSRILSASSAATAGAPPGYYGYGYGSEYAEDGSVSAVPLGGGHPGIRRRFSSSELSLSAVGGRSESRGDGTGSVRSKRPAKSKTSLSIASNPGRRQPGVLEVVRKNSTAPSAKVTITQPSEDGRSLTPTPSESGLSGTGTEGDRMSIPEHQLRNLKLFGYKPFSGRTALSPVPDKSSMENSQSDLKLDSASAGSGVKKGPVFNIRGLLLSPRSRDKAKDGSSAPHAEGKDKPAAAAGAIGAAKDGFTEPAQSRSQSKEPAGKEQEAQSSPPKKRRFNLARAIIDSARRGGGGEPEAEKTPKAPVPPKKADDDDDDGDGGERRKMALKMKLGIVRSGVRKDSEGNGVKEKKGKGKKGAGATGAASAKGKKGVKPPGTKGGTGNKKGTRGKGKSFDEDDDEDEDEYGRYGRRGPATGGGPTKGSKKSAGGGGMLKSALNYAASFRTRGSERNVGTAGGAAGGRKKPSASELPKGATKGGPTKGAGKELDKAGTPNARRRDKSAKAVVAGSSDQRGKSGTARQGAGATGASGAGRMKSGKAPQASTGPGASNRAKSAAGPRGKTLRRSSSALAIDAGQQRKMNKLYEKNQKAATGPGGLLGLGGRGAKNTSSLISKVNRQSNDGGSGSGAGGAAGGSLSKSDSRGELRGKGSSKMTDSGGGGGGGGSGYASDSKERFEKRDSDRSLKKSDSNKSIATMGGKGKKSDSKSSLLTKRSDSRSSLHQSVAGGDSSAGAGGDTSGTELGGGKSPYASGVEGATEGVKSARPTPKLQSKGSLLSLLSLKTGSKRNLDRGAAGAGGDTVPRPDTAATIAPGADGMMASSTRLKSASVRNAAGAMGAAGGGAAAGADGGGGEETATGGGVVEKPMSTKPLRRLMSRGSLLSIKSIAHARSFTNIRPPTAGGAGADGTGGGGGGGGGGAGAGEGMPAQTMTKVTEGSQEHDDTTDTDTSHGGTGGAGGTDGQGSMGVATHELTVAGDGEGEKVSNEYNGDRMRSPMAEHRQQGGRSPEMDNVSSANTESMRDRTMGPGAGGGNASNSDEFDEDEQAKCSKCCCACCAPCWTRTCLPFRRCFRRCCSGCCGGRARLGKRTADGQLAKDDPKAAKGAPKGHEPEAGAGGSCWSRLLGCCRRCRNSKTSPETTAVVARPAGAAAGESTKKSCWQSLNCCASCRRNKSRELVPRSSIDSDPPAEQQSRCRSCWSKLLCCCRPKPEAAGKSNIKRTRMVDKEAVEMETVKCCFCFKRQRPKVKAKSKRKMPVRSTFNCFSCCMMCCKKKGDNQSRRTSNLSKKQSIAPTIPPEDLRPKIDMSLVEHSSLMRGAIPVLPLCLAYFCLLLNVLLPGTGTVLSGGLCLCIGKPRFSQHDSIKGRIGSFIINCIVGVSQCFTIIFCVVGWGWAIWWGTIMLRLAKQHQKILEMEAAQDDGEDQTTLSQRTGASNPPVAMVSKTHRDVETGR